MGYAPSALQECPNIQAELNDFFATCNSRFLREPTPLFDFAMSPVNRGGFSQAVSPGQGKVKTYELRFSQRILESAVTQPGSIDRSCTATTKRGDLLSTCEIDPADYFRVEEKIGVNDFIYACRNDFDIIAEKLTMMMNVLMARVATDVAEQIITLKGNWNKIVSGVDGSDFLVVKTLKDGTTQDLSGLAFEEIDAAFMQTQYCAGQAIFSGRDLWKYFRLMNASCCANDGLALDQVLAQYGKAILYDYRVEKAFGDPSKAIAIQPGSIQVVTHNMNGANLSHKAAAGITYGTNYQSQIIFDPQSGFPVDLTMRDECPGELHIMMDANPKVCGLPTDLFAPGDNMEGVTYVNGIKVTNV